MWYRPKCTHVYSLVWISWVLKAWIWILRMHAGPEPSECGHMNGWAITYQQSHPDVTPQWVTADAAIKDIAVENTEFKDSPF